MCARLIPHQPAGSQTSLNGSKGSPADVNSSSASYRVLGSGRQRPWLSVDRKAMSRNASEAIELRQISRVLGVQAVWSVEDHAESPRDSDLTGVREHSALPRQMMSKQDKSCFAREPRRSRGSQVETEIEVPIQGRKLKKVHTPTLEVRWWNSSKEVG
jgi:hypothetical protein